MTGTHRDPQPHRYKICVRGRLGETLRSAFPTFQARTRGNDTMLTGVLAEIEALGLELIEVRRLAPRRPNERST